MKYVIDYQYRPKGANRPQDDGELFPIEARSTDIGVVVLPVVGDYVSVLRSKEDGGAVSGKVASRYFRYMPLSGTPDESACIVNIVIEETDDDFGRLVKE